jgi:hypothetical protein
LASIVDTIRSVNHYFDASHKIVIVDNSRKGTGECIQETHPDIDVVKGRHQGKFARLFLNISAGTAHAYEHYRFDVLLRMDADALIIGARPEEDALARFKAQPELGQLGVYETDFDGKKLKWWPIDLSMAVQAINPLSWVSPAWNGWHFRKLLVAALRRGYRLGAHIYGGGFFLSYPCVERLYQMGVLTNDRMSNLRLQEDHITSVAVVAAGFKLGDFASGAGPMAQAWRGLPAAPETLIARGKKVVHSVHYYREMKETDVRGFFRERRSGGMPS